MERLLVFIAVLSASSALSNRELLDVSTLVWMCLERCPSFNVTLDLAQLSAHRADVTLVSPENWQVGPNGEFEWATASGVPVSDVRQAVQALGYPYWPMLTAGSIAPLRALFANPAPFMKAAVATAKQLNYIGYHIDFEPDSGADAADAVAYAAFLDTFAGVLHEHGLVLGADVATWSPFWNFTLLAGTSTDKIYTMETYTTNMQRFEAQVQFTVQALGVQQAGIAIDSDIGSGFNTSMLDFMLQVLEENNVTSIGLWHDSNRIGDQWWPFFASFLAR
eukprot:TRINITY_DN8757_c0_g1_i1.p1 TRINITY_DN8757_c0_g1~~TRINITY_DN8757_c0_g1_i1.p1  ORF type:complete len:278 (+),score=106.48 TRINITY_DN8757_c0_g1_i1:657-1490(+)